MNLITSDTFQDVLKNHLRSAERINILSAYFTLDAAKFLLSEVNDQAQVEVIIRARPEDLINRSTHIEAIQLLHDNQYKCFLHESLHAKLYTFNDEYGYVSSANFTSNGLKLSGYGNLELSTCIQLTEQDNLLIECIKDASILLTDTVLSQIMNYLDEKVDIDKKTIEIFSWWDSLINLPKQSQSIFIADLPWCHLDKKNSTENKQHDLDVFALFSHEISSNSFKSSKIFKFLKYKFQEHDQDFVYFGLLTKWIHDSLQDDVMPYRSTIKEYVGNLLSYINKYAKDECIVDRPNYSQRLIMKNLNEKLL